MSIEVTESLLRAVASKDKQISDGRSIARKGAFKNPGRTEDGLLWADCHGSAVYKTSVDLAPGTPIVRCSCPVKPPPCKHGLGLLVFFMEQAAKFKVSEPPADLAEKRQKSVERAEKKVEAKPKKVNKEALEKKTQEQKDGLELLERLVLDAAGAGLGTIDAKRAERLVEQSKQMTDAYLPGAAIALKRMAGLALAGTRRKGADDDDDEAEEVYEELEEPGRDLPDDERRRLMVRHLARLWAMVRRGQKHLEAKLDEGESQSDADAVVEELLGRVWQLSELKEKGHWRSGVRLYELAFERWDDQIREERIEQSFLLDLGDGAVHVDRAYRPFQALERTKMKESFEKQLQVSEAALYPGFVNRRIRWELMAMKQSDPDAAMFSRLHELALTVEAALGRLKEQLKNPLAPDDAVLLVKAKDLVRTSAGPALVDPSGARLLLRDSPLARSKTTTALELAAGAAQRDGALAQPASLLVRLWVGLQDNLVYGQPLALVAGDRRVRLGL